MNITFNQLKTFYNALKNKMKGFRGNWNQNDPTADDYIKNRPFYSEVKEYIIIDNLSSINYNNGEYPRCNFVPNQSYDIIWNGTLYKNVVCIFDDPYHFLGGSNSNYPFYIDDDGGNSLHVEGEGDWTLSILTTQELVHQINPKYVPLPEGVVNEKDLSDVAWTGSYNDLNDKPLVVQADISQSLTVSQKEIARQNIGAASINHASVTINNNAVKYSAEQSLTDEQKATARNNIGAGTSNFSGDYNDLENKLIYSTIIKDIIYMEQYLTSSAWNPTEQNNGKDSYYSYPVIQGAFHGPETGEICEINLSGQIFEAEVKQGNTSESWWLGNQNIYDQSYDDTGESFYITMTLDIGNKYRYHLYSRAQEKITYISITKKGYTEYHQLDENYIPDTIARIGNVDYNDLKNKPVYYDIITYSKYDRPDMPLTYALSITDTVISAEYDIPIITAPAPIIGNIYEINIGGKIYKAKLKVTATGNMHFGNGAIRGQMSEDPGDTGEDFYIRLSETSTGDILYRLYLAHGQQITYFSITGFKYHQLDENYIPDTIARVSDLQNILPEATTDDNGKVLGIADGEWTKVAMNEGVSQEYVDNALAQKSQVQMITWEADD